MKEFHGLRSPVRCVTVTSRQRPGQRRLLAAPASRGSHQARPGSQGSAQITQLTELPLCWDKDGATDDKSRVKR